MRHHLGDVLSHVDWPPEPQELPGSRVEPAKRPGFGQDDQSVRQGSRGLPVVGERGDQPASAPSSSQLLTLQTVEHRLPDAERHRQAESFAACDPGLQEQEVGQVPAEVGEQAQPKQETRLSDEEPEGQYRQSDDGNREELVPPSPDQG